MKKLSCLFVLLLFAGMNQSFAQFEGTIQIQNYQYESGQKQKDDAFTMFITPDRMMLKGEDDYKVGGSLKTHGILIRMKEKDFVFLTGDETAMKISKAGITSFMNMFGDDVKDNAGDEDSNIKVEKTGKSKKINGYAADEFIFTNSDEPNERAEVWMTKGLHINWGMLAEPWGSDKLEGFMGSNIPLDLVLKQGYFPVIWKQYDNDELESMAEANIKKGKVESSSVEIPKDVKVTSLQNYLFQQMRQQQ